MSLVTRSGDVGDRRKTGEMSMKCVAETFSGAVGVCLTQGRRTGGGRRMGPPGLTRACGGERVSLIACAAIAVLLTACGQENRFVAPPPPKVAGEKTGQKNPTPHFWGARQVAPGDKNKTLAPPPGEGEENK